MAKNDWSVAGETSDDWGVVSHDSLTDVPTIKDIPITDPMGTAGAEIMAAAAPRKSGDVMENVPAAPFDFLRSMETQRMVNAAKEAKRDAPLDLRAAPPPIQPRGSVRAVADTGLGIYQGAAGLVKGVTDNINAGDNPVSNFLDTAIAGADRLKSDDLRQQQINRAYEIYAANKNLGEVAATRAAFNTLFSQPAAGLDVAAKGGGSIVPTVALGAAGLGTRAMGAVNALSNAGDAASQTADTLRKLPPEVWANDPDYQTLISKGVPHDEAVALLAPVKALPAQAVGGIAGAVSGSTGAEKVLAGTAVGNNLRARAGRAGAELLGEQGETLLPQITGNATVGNIDGTTGITQGVGQAAVDTLAGTVPGAAIAARHGTASPEKQIADAITQAVESGQFTQSAQDIARARLDPNTVTPQAAPTIPQAKAPAGWEIAEQAPIQENPNAAAPQPAVPAAVPAADPVQPASVDVGRNDAAVPAQQPEQRQAVDTAEPVRAPAQGAAPVTTESQPNGTIPTQAVQAVQNGPGLVDSNTSAVPAANIGTDRSGPKPDLNQPNAAADALPQPAMLSEKAQQITQPAEGLRPGDIVATSGKPFKTKAQATTEARHAGKGWQVKKGAGGFVVRYQPQTAAQIAATKRLTRAANQVDTHRDSLFAAIAKSGGLSMDAATKEWGFDPAEFKNLRVGIKPVVRKEGGRSLDAMAERLAEMGYLSSDEHGKHDVSEFFDLFDGELRGNKHFTPQGFENQAAANQEGQYQDWLSQQTKEELDAQPEADRAIETFTDEFDVGEIDAAEEARIEREAIEAESSGTLGRDYQGHDARTEEVLNRTFAEGAQGAQGGTDAGKRASDFALSSETVAQARARTEQEAQQRAEQERKNKEQDQRAQADGQRDSFTLTGSDRPADTQAAQGQKSLLDDSNDVLFSKADGGGNAANNAAPVFYSALQRAFTNSKQETMPGAQWLAWLNSNAGKLGVKKDEITWSGIEDYLNLRGKDKLTREEVAQFVADNGVKVEEVKKGASTKPHWEGNDLIAPDGKIIGTTVDDYETYVFREVNGKIFDTGANRMSDAVDRIEAKYGSTADTEEKTKYHDYTLPGGENYRELLLTLPTKGIAEPKGEVVEDGKSREYPFAIMVNGIEENRSSSRESADSILQEEIDRARSKAEKKAGYSSSHWTEPNILAHIRFNDRTDADGKRVLFIEELQSDWAQQGKKKGFKVDPKRAATLDARRLELEKIGGQLRNDGQEIPAEIKQEWADIMNELQPENTARVPFAPFVTDTKNWLALGIKRMVRYAAENGYDKVAFINGQQSANRYDLSKQVESLLYAKNEDGTYALSAITGGRGQMLGDSIQESKLEDYVGKEVAKKIVNGDGKRTEVQGERKHMTELRGLDLKVGGEGMKTFYDRIVPQVANDVLKKIGGNKVGDVMIDGQRPAGWQEKYDAAINAGRHFTAEKLKAEDAIAPQPGFDITPAMRESVMGGQLLFNKQRGTSLGKKVFDLDLGAAIGQGKSVDALLFMIENRSANPQFRELANTLRTLKLKTTFELGTTQGRKFEVQSVGEHNVRASYNSSTDRAVLYRMAGAEAAILHELVHAATVKAINANTPAGAELLDLFKQVQEHGDWSSHYGMENVKEFIAEALTNPRFQEALRNTMISSDGKVSFWQKLVALIRAMLGKSVQTSALDEVMRLAPDLFAENQTIGQHAHTAAAAASMVASPDTIEVDGAERSRTNSDGHVINYLDKNLENFWHWYDGPVDDQGRPIVKDRHYINADGQRKAIDNVGTWDAKQGSVLYSKADDTVNGMKVDRSQDDLNFGPRTAFNVPDPGVLDNILRAMQNNKIDLKRVQEAIKATGSTITEGQDAYLNEELYIGKVTDLLDKFAERRVTPMLEAINKAGLTLDEVNTYLYARHAPERNAQLKKINPNRINNDRLSGMSDNQARKIMADFKEAGKDAKLAPIAAMVDNITKESRRRLVAQGLETGDVVAAWEAVYKNYVPLMADMDAGPKRGKGGYNVKGPESQRALGQLEQSQNILANVIAQAQSGIMRSEKAKVGRSLLDLARQFPNDQFWKVDEPPKKRRINPDTGLAEWAEDPLFKAKDNVLVVKENGKEHFIVFNETNERAMQLAAAMQNLDAAQLPWVIEATGKFTRHLAQWITARNPLFWMTNFARDVQHAAFNLADTPISGKEATVLKNIPMAMQGYWKITRGDGAGQWAEYAKEFKSAGAETGFVKVFDSPSDHMKDLQKQFDQMQQGAADPRKLARSMVEAIDDYNNIIENGVRLAVYQTARENGVSIRRAASLAKNITVNFNRRGNQSTFFNALYMFMNANIQGHARFFAVLATSRKAQAVAGALVGMGFMLDIIGRAFGGDDDQTKRKKYDEIPDFEKEKNWIFMYPDGSGRYIKIPMPQGPHLMVNMGRMISESLFSSKKTSAIERALQLARVTVDSFNPLGAAGSFSQLIAPTLAKPIVQIESNKTFTGAPMYREGDDRHYVGPAYTRHFRSTADHWVEASKLLSDITGGDRIKPGKIDIPPEVLRTLLTSYVAPGVTQAADKAVDTATRSAQGKKVEPSQVPGLSRFYGEAPEQRAQERAYYEEQKRVKQSLEQVRKYAKAGDRAGMERTFAELGDGDAKKGRQIKAEVDAAEKGLADLNKRRALLENDKIPDHLQKRQLDQIEERRIALMRRILN